MSVSHEFGGQHTELKLSIVESYLKAYTQALRSQFQQLWYIDAFAGTGTRTVRTIAKDGGLFEEPTVERIDIRRGSAQIALDVKPSFDRLVFIEARPSYCAALRELCGHYPGRNVEIVEGDANKAIQSQIEWSGWRTTRAVMFLDPYGMEVEWATLQAAAATQAIDVWFLFPLAGLYRQATRRLTDIDDHKRAALTRMFGSDRWEEELYPRPGQNDMFGGDVGRERLEDVAGD
jgi:three-Cys-motif partner protein